MKNTFGSAVGLTIFGESHGAAIGAVLDGLAAGLPVDEAYIARQMDKRRARGGGLSTARKEADAVRFISGVYNGHTTGTAVTLLIENQSQHSADYAKTADLLRPGHADYTAFAKYGGGQDARGGGHFSGRITAAVVAAGALCQSVLAAKGVRIGTHLLACAGVQDAAFAQDEASLAAQLTQLDAAEEFALLDAGQEEAVRAAILAAAAEGDSVGGLLETAVLGLPAGLGEPFFDSVESELSHLLFSIPAVKGVQFGDGFALAEMRGSAANDPFCMQGSRIITETNHNGGVNGGISNGMPLRFSTVIKPTPSIYKKQHTVNYATRTDAELQIEGRHDPCIAQRARVVQDSVTAFGLLDLATVCYGTGWQREE